MSVNRRFFSKNKLILPDTGQKGKLIMQKLMILLVGGFLSLFVVSNAEAKRAAATIDPAANKPAATAPAEAKGQDSANGDGLSFPGGQRQAAQAPAMQAPAKQEVVVSTPAAEKAPKGPTCGKFLGDLEGRVGFNGRDATSDFNERASATVGLGYYLACPGWPVQPGFMLEGAYSPFWSFTPDQRDLDLNPKGQGQGLVTVRIPFPDGRALVGGGLSSGPNSKVEFVGRVGINYKLASFIENRLVADVYPTRMYDIRESLRFTIVDLLYIEGVAQSYIDITNNSNFYVSQEGLRVGKVLDSGLDIGLGGYRLSTGSGAVTAGMSYDVPTP